MMGKRIFEIIKKNKISSKKFADSIGVGTGVVSNWINGRSNPKIECVIKICEIYNVDANWLLGIQKE